MKISLNWLKEYINLSESAPEIGELLTQRGLEVEGIETYEPIKGGLQGLVIGKVITCEDHPYADRLKKTRVDVGNNAPIPIICGAPNVKVGQKVVVALVGTTLNTYEGKTIKIKKAKIRGEFSEGMLCTEEEIGVGQAHEGILVFDTSLPLGTPVAKYFNIQQDTVLEIDLTPNRADAFSHIGVARELKAILDRPISYPIVENFTIDTQDLPMQVEIVDHDACPRYSGVAMKGVTVRESPEWLKNKLKAIGVNPVNNVVDVTNFVLHELGQPLHAFDYDQIVGKKVWVKALPQDSSFVTLDNKTRKLRGEELMICDEAGGLCIAGVLGGKRASVNKATQNIFLESAYFSPKSITRTTKQHTIKTDASFRYERGTDPNLTVYTLKRACLLIKEIAHGKVASEIIDIYPEKIKDVSIKVSYRNIDRLIGKAIPKSAIKAILNRLAITISHEEKENFIAIVPPFRVDVKREVDVIEEIVRIYGYENIEVSGKLSSSYLAEAIKPERDKVQYSIAELLAADGYYEIYTNSLTKSVYTTFADDLNEPKNTYMLNPLSEVLDVLRQTLVFSGLEVIAYNINRNQTDLKFFEFGKTYHKESNHYVENNRLAIWITGNIEAPNWIRKPSCVTFQNLNAIIHKILHKLDIVDVAREHFKNSFYEAGLKIKSEGEELLRAGKLNMLLLKKMGITQPLFFADIDWDLCLRQARKERKYEEISKFPTVKRDLSLVIDKSVTFEAIKKIVTRQNEKIIKHVNIFDVYEGKPIEKGKKAYALSFVLQEKNKTLNDKLIDKVMRRLIEAFKDQLGAVIRK
ncbi:MAG: phenylalanine--tRNA ligase subunit beta [Cytophagales bacterium]|nr:phenylalanine--tRNA ligase subunit beta [Cytophagales bacterium]